MVKQCLVRGLVVNPEDLPETIISVTGISGKKFESNSRLIYMEIKHGDRVTLERVLVQETCGNILSYNTMQRLGIANERQGVKEKKEPLLKIMSAVPEKKKSACEASWKEVDGVMKCDCPVRELPEKYLTKQ